MAADPFDPEGIHWRRVSPRLIVVRLIGSTIGMLVVMAALIAAATVFDNRWIWLAAGVILLLDLIALALIAPRVRSWGYAERADDLLIKHGLMYKVLVVVPYGRMQYVDVKAGPLDRMIGLASVQLHTASAGSDASIPGLPAAEAARLRDRLASRGESTLAGL